MDGGNDLVERLRAEAAVASRSGQMERLEAIARDVERLCIDFAYMEDIARCRGEENESLRAAVRTLDRVVFKDWWVVTAEGDGIALSIGFNEHDARSRAEYWLDKCGAGYRLDLVESEQWIGPRHQVRRETIADASLPSA